jgi:uncharacterized protein YbbC (DUF1343 family)
LVYIPVAGNEILAPVVKGNEIADRLMPWRVDGVMYVALKFQDVLLSFSPRLKRENVLHPYQGKEIITGSVQRNDLW